MRIAHYGISLWLNGGVANYVRRIAATQRTAGHDVFFFDDRPGDPETPSEWRAQAVRALAEDHALASRLGANARERLLANYGIEDHMGQLYRHYREVIAA
jgi:hypothetical protein